MANRDKLELRHDLLQCCLSKQRISAICTTIRTSHNIATAYLAEMATAGLIKIFVINNETKWDTGFNNQGMGYVTTEKGSRAIQTLNLLTELFKPLEMCSSCGLGLCSYCIGVGCNCFDNPSDETTAQIHSKIKF